MAQVHIGRSVLTLVRPTGEQPCCCCEISKEGLQSGSAGCTLRSIDAMKRVYAESLCLTSLEERERFMGSRGQRAVYVSINRDFACVFVLMVIGFRIHSGTL